MKVKRYNYLYTERMDGQPVAEGLLYAKLFKTYAEAKAIFDHVVSLEEGGYIGPADPVILDKFTSLSGKIIEITLN